MQQYEKKIQLTFVLYAIRMAHLHIFINLYVIISRQVPAMPLAYYNRQGKLTRSKFKPIIRLQGGPIKLAKFLN